MRRTKGIINPRVYGDCQRRTAASRAAHVRQPCSARAWDEKRTRPLEKSQTNTSPSLPSRLEEHALVARTPHTTQFLCARNACSLPSLSLLLFLVGVVWDPVPDVGVSWPGTLPPVRARRPTESEPLSMSSRASVSYGNGCFMDHARTRIATRSTHQQFRGGCGRRGPTSHGSGTCVRG
jgi:hypothetical protein